MPPPCPPCTYIGPQQAPALILPLIRVQLRVPLKDAELGEDDEADGADDGVDAAVHHTNVEAYTGVCVWGGG